MSRSAPVFLLGVVCASALFAQGAADEAQAAPEGSRVLRVVVSGGPARADIEVEINGEFALLVADEEAGLFHSIDGLLKPGVNELRLLLKQPEAAREAGDDVRIAISAVEEDARRVRTTGDPLAQLTVPGDADPAAACSETVSFSTDPMPPRPTDLKNQYWLFVTGPPARSRVLVTVNGSLVANVSAGTYFQEITHFVKKGKNSVQFDVQPSCLVSQSGQRGPLQLTIAPAKMEHDVVEMTEPAAVEFDVDPKKTGEPRTVQRAFRAW